MNKIIHANLTIYDEILSCVQHTFMIKYFGNYYHLVRQNVSHSWSYYWENIFQAQWWGISGKEMYLIFQKSRSSLHFYTLFTGYCMQFKFGMMKYFFVMKHVIQSLYLDKIIFFRKKVKSGLIDWSERLLKNASGIKLPLQLHGRKKKLLLAVKKARASNI